MINALFEIRNFWTMMWFELIHKIKQSKALSMLYICICVEIEHVSDDIANLSIQESRIRYSTNLFGKYNTWHTNGAATIPKKKRENNFSTQSSVRIECGMNISARRGILKYNSVMYTLKLRVLHVFV